MHNAQATALYGIYNLNGPQSTRLLGKCPDRGRVARMASLRYLWPDSVDVPGPLSPSGSCGAAELVRGQGRRGSGDRFPVADPRAKLRAPRGDIFPAGPPAPAAAWGSGVGPGAAGSPLHGGRPGSPGAGSRPTRAAGGIGAAET